MVPNEWATWNKVVRNLVKHQAATTVHVSLGVRAFRGDRLREARLSRGLSAKDLAALIGVTPGAISRYERGMDKPLQKRIDAISRHLGVPESFLCSPRTVQSD
jgi:ribosome-binding protein aMBF1 (putative translation factor)